MAKAQNYKVGILFGAQKARGFDKTFKGVNTSLTGVTKKVTGLIGAYAGVSAFKDAVTTFGDFEQSMANVSAVSGATGNELKALETKALDLGKKTSKSAKEAADALGYMSLAGWDSSTSMKALEPVLRLSEAGNIDLATTSDLVTDSMSALNVSVDNLPKFLDQAAQTSRKANTDVGGLMEAFIGCGGALNNLNVPLEEGSTMLGVLANRGIKGSEAGTKLNAIITNLTTGAGQAGKAMQALNIDAFDEVTGEFKGMETVLKEVNDKTKSLTEEQRNSYFAMIGGKTQIDTLNALMSGLNTTNKDGVNEFDSLKTSIVGSDGALDEMATTMTGTMNGAFGKAKSAIDDFKINSIKELEPYITDAATWFAEKLPTATEVFAQKIGPVIDTAAVQVGKFLTVAKKGYKFTVKHWSVIKPILKGVAVAFASYKGAKVIGNTAKAVKNVGSAFGKAKIAIKGHADTYKIATSYAKDYAKIGAKSVGKGFKKVGSFAKTGGKALVSGIGKSFKVMGGLAKAGIGFITSPVGIAVVAVTALIAAGVLLWKNWDKIKEKATQLKIKIEKGIDVISQKFPWLGSIMKGQFSAIKGVVGGLKTSFEGIVDFVGGVFTGDWGRAWEGVKGIFKGVFESFEGLAKAPINAVIGVINGAIKGINQIGVDIPDWVPEDLGGGKSIGFSIPEIPMLASGGVATKATLAMVGEGKENEAILPLSKLKQLININPSAAQPIVKIYLQVSGGANPKEFESQLPKIKAMIIEALKEIESRNKMVSLNY